MATKIDTKELGMQEQLASIRRHLAEIDQREVQTAYEPKKFWISAVLAAAGLMGGGAALMGIVLR